MKVEVIKTEEVEDEIKYPILMESTNKEIIVLFLSSEVGLAVHSEYSDQLYQYSDNWVSACDKNRWKKFTGQIILKND